MNRIEVDIPISIAQISYQTPTTSSVNPTEIILGRNSTYTDIRRMYIQFDLSSIPTRAIIDRAYFNIIIKNTTNNNSLTPAKVMGFLVTSAVSNIAAVTWNNMPAFNIYSSFYNKNVYGNSTIQVDVTNYVKSFISGALINNGFMFINNEAIYNQVFMNTNMNEEIGISMIVEYYDPEASAKSENIVVNVLGNSYVSQSFLIDAMEYETLFIKNLGTAPITANVEISGNGIDFIADNTTGPIAPNTTKALIPYYYAKYIRVTLIGTQGYINSNISFQGKY